MSQTTSFRSELLKKVERIRKELVGLAKDVPDNTSDEIYEINFFNTNNGNKNIESYWNINESKMREWFSDDELNALENMGWKIWQICG